MNLRNRNSIFGLIAIVTTVVFLNASGKAQRLHCGQDTLLVMQLLEAFNEQGGDPSTKVGPIAERLVGADFAQVNMTDTIAEPVIRLDGFDELSFLNTVTALARLSTTPGHKRLREYSDELTNISCRRGECSGFSSRMLYGADWALDNKARNNVKELTESYSDNFKTKSLDWVTRHRDRYAALGDSANYEDQRMVEMGFRTHKIPHMRRESTEWKDVAADLRDGDILMLLTPEQTTDTYEIGILRKREDGFHFIHPSEAEGKVVEEKETIGRYIKRNAKKIYGYRWLRLAK